ncbi:hypothetical protein IEQ34_004734 [Dendrobium chrysotoxum]|uniref:eRF1 domain-containing protein n=1 Tax=Dendrobium chrysotoxum TaxID=161865 RepID=A0AAV7HG13_DENCH|nr:hypothetical protein IEQ34_004734 [Dendrobium chrysotoxum]
MNPNSVDIMPCLDEYVFQTSLHLEFNWQDTGKYVFGVDDTLKALDMGAVEIKIVWENLDINRYVLKNSATGEPVSKHLNKDQESDQNNFRDSDTFAELEVQDKLSLLEWLANEYKQFGCSLEFYTNKSQEGSQFCGGFCCFF